MSTEYKIRFRVANALLGAWLFVSAFLWPHTMAQRANALVVGMLTVLVAIAAALLDPKARYLNAVFGAWLCLTAFGLASIDTTSRWNDLFVGILILACSLEPPEPKRLAGPELHE